MKQNNPLEQLISDTENVRKTDSLLSFSKGLQLITQERHEQIYKHGYDVTDPENWQYYDKGELMSAIHFILTGETEWYPESWGMDFIESMKGKEGRLTGEQIQIEKLKIIGAFAAAQIDYLLSKKGKENPLAEFGRKAAASNNPHYPYEIGGKKFTEGNYVGGTWVNERGESFYQEGTICYSPANGLMVEDFMSLGVTPLKLFYTMEHIRRP